MKENLDPREAYSVEEFDTYEHETGFDSEDEFDNDDYEDDGQPSEYDEWQDLYGGDDWDHGQYDDCGQDW